MKVGDYVRTPKGIGKINQMYSDKKDTFIYLDCGITIDYITKDFTEEEINKMYPSSPQIIDLIEVGDIIRGKDNHLFEVYAVGSDCVYINNLEEFILIKDIKGIVTKERFSQMEYRIGE